MVTQILLLTYSERNKHAELLGGNRANFTDLTDMNYALSF